MSMRHALRMDAVFSLTLRRNTVLYFRPYCVAISILLGVVLAGDGELLAQETGEAPNTAIPVELSVLIAGSEDNISRIKSLVFEGTTVIEDDSFSIAKDLDGLTYRQQTVHTRIWKVGSCMRSDTTFDRTFDKQTGKVIYHLPYGEHMARVGTVNMEELYRKYGTTETTYRYLQISDKDETYLYRSQGKDRGLRRWGDLCCR